MHALTPFARRGIETKAKKLKEGGCEEGFRGEKGGRKATLPVRVVILNCKK